WQLQGTDDTLERCHVVASGSNTASWVFRYGDDAPDALAGRLRLYFHAKGRKDQASLEVAIGLSEVATDADSVSSFASEDGYGFWRPEKSNAHVRALRTFQGVPLATGAVRLFAEISGADGVSRLVAFDSQDGWYGRDFHPGAATVVAGADYGRAVEMQVVLDAGASGLSQVRQSKLGWPALDHWTWDAARDGAFLVITGADRCGQTRDGLFLASWRGAAFEVNAADGCATPLVPQAHGPVVVHLGAGRYKLYYEDQTAGMTRKSFRMISADASRTGDPSVVEPGDWDPVSEAREVAFRWPSGAEMSLTEESGLGDHVIAMPLGSTTLQVMYLNLGGKDTTAHPGMSRGVGLAYLVNP
ncbi:MAG: hypothetical protein GY884_23380, partial [Proteobacteria bacterium]|nr:hypothetical protein [Pseudomonadota bacterium]